MSEQLRVDIGDLEGRVVAEGLLDVRLRTLHEEAVVVRKVVAKVKMEESHDVDALKVPVMQDV